MSINDNLKGAIVGAILTGVAGNLLGVTLGLPEEVITMPTGAVVGGLMGYKRIKRFLP